MRRAVQILVVVLILLTCTGMLSVGIVQVREAANRAQCYNNCRLIGMSMITYDEQNNGYLRAALPNAELDVEKRLSWLVILMPYVEANQTHARMNKEKSWDAEENRFATEMRLTYLQCPGYFGPSPIGPLGPTDYVAMSGIGDNAAALPREDSRAGIFGYDRPVKRNDLNRGAGETILAVETSQVHGAWTAAGSPTTRGLIPNGSSYIGAGGQFGGNHRKGASTTFADGSVRFIESSIDPTVFEAMATLSGKGNWE